LIVCEACSGNLGLPSRRVKQSNTPWPLKVEPIGCSETSVITNYIA
jgi:hypothetical protein